MVEKVTAKFRAADGREFESESDATAHEELRGLKAAYEEARQAYARKLWETQKTADGVPFRLDTFNKYYHIADYFGFPSWLPVSFYIWACDLDDEDEATVRQQPDSGREGWETYKISELYYYKGNAERALLAAQRRWLAKKQAEMGDLAKRLGESA